MTQKRLAQLAAALFLLGAGLITLVHGKGVQPDVSGLPWSCLFAGSGMLLLRAFFADQEHWWPLILAFALFAVGLPGFLNQLVELSDGVAGVVVFSCLAAGFLIPFLAQPRRNWWTLIPAGILFTVGVIALYRGLGNANLAAALAIMMALGLILVGCDVSQPAQERRGWWGLVAAGMCFALGIVMILSRYMPAPVTWGVFILSLSLTTAVLSLLRPADGPQWAWLLSLALMALGMAVPLTPEQFPRLTLLWPTALLLAGLALLVATLRGLRLERYRGDAREPFG